MRSRMSDDHPNLNLRVLNETTKPSVVAADNELLLTMYTSNQLDTQQEDNSKLLLKALKTVLKSVRNATSNLERRNQEKRDFFSLLLTILRPADIDDETRKEVLDYMVQTIALGNPQDQHRRKIITAATYKAGVLYHFLRQYETSQSLLVLAFRWCVNLHRLEGAKNLLYVVASMDKCTLARIVSSSYSNDLLPLALCMIDLGIFCYHRNCVDDERPKDKTFDKLISKVKEQPLSLQQLARLVIRENMRDVEVVRDCYRLPLPRILQDYVSFNFLNPTIAHMFFDDFTATDYNLPAAVYRQYGVRVRLPAPLLAEENKNQRRLADDIAQLENE